jgi:hypothetical protein
MGGGGGGGGGGVCRKFESFVGNLGGFAPPGKSEFPPLHFTHTTKLLTHLTTCFSIPSKVNYHYQMYV